MQFTREINRLLIITLVAFGLIAVAAAYWSVIGPDTILLREDNPRRVEAEASVLRGRIFDRTDTLLIESQAERNNLTVTRQYLYPEANSALGYFSLRYGVGGAEAAYDTLLRGDDIPHDLANDLLHIKQQGSDIRLTFDLALQKRLAQAMQGQSGAAVVLAVPSGEVLALISLPTYNPNTLDADWETLTQAPGKPFFNRAIQGNYQPGGILQTPLIAAALLANHPLEMTIDNATRPVSIANVELNCAAVLSLRSLTLREAYAFACPSAFISLVDELGISTLEATFKTFQLDQPPTLEGFIVNTNNTPQPAPSLVSLTSDNLLKNALGQGQLTVSPLEMAVIAAAVVNDGNAPQPYTLLATRRPGSVTWTPAQGLRPSIPLTTANTARQLQDMMRLAVAKGAAQNAGRPNIDIGGHAALAYSGNSSQAWFIGFATLGGRQGAAVAVVLENSSDPGLAADIGGTALAMAHERLQGG
jgi:peptidoglycan glycosyltransferase